MEGCLSGSNRLQLLSFISFLSWGYLGHNTVACPVSLTMVCGLGDLILDLLNVLFVLISDY